jgi:oligopeptidase A
MRAPRSAFITMTSNATTNPLLAGGTAQALPGFARFDPEHVTPAIDTLLADAGAALDKATSANVAADYDTLSAVLDVPVERLQRAWGTVSHLNAVVDTPALRATYNDNLPRVTAFFTQLGADERLYAKYKAIEASPGARELSAPRRAVLRHALRDFVLSGAQLQGAAKERFVQIQERQAAIAQSFREHVLDATDGYAYFATPSELDGVPEDIVWATRVDPSEAVKAGASPDAVHRLTLQQPVYAPVQQYARNRALRERLHRAYITRASELGADPALDNGPLMSELLHLRAEEAALLGHDSYADVSLVPKMAASPDDVLAFLRRLAARAKPFAQRDMDAVRAHASTLGLHDVQPWDIAFVSERLKEQNYAFSEQEVKQYFTEPRVFDGLFRIVQTVFEVTITPDHAQTWHSDVRFYRVERDGKLLAQFYLDTYARTGKQPGAWMDDARIRWHRPDGAMQTPVALLTCNFAPPVDGKPALLTHDDVITLFHEFGHGLHLMLSQIDDIGVSGLSGVEWDAVELPSQFMENFCWEWDVLRELTAHVDTGQPLPRALYDKMLAAKNFQSGMQTVRQVEFALFDLRIHHEAGSADRIQTIMDEVRREVSVVPVLADNRFQHAFSHIFGGGYAAGYYSYKWAEVLSADAWSAFEEEGVLSVRTGRRLREEILERGGSRDAMDNFKAFRGREPSLEALMRHQGMTLDAGAQRA